MNNLQQYLNNLENKQEIKEINLTQIQQERGENELLEGGELDLREFTNLEKVEIDPKLLKTPLTKLNVDGLTHLKELDWLESKEDTPEEKKLWTELGIENENEKKEVVKEINRLVKIWTKAEDEPIKVHFATEKAPKEQLGDKESIIIIPENKEDGYNIYLNLERKDKQDNFCPSLVFWSLTQELTLINNDNYDKNPLFWTNFDKELNLVKQNLIGDYQKEFELLLNPSTFSTEKLEISELLSIYYPNMEEIPTPDGQSISKEVNKEIIDKTWQTMREKVLELTSQELSKNPNEEELKKLSIRFGITENNGNYLVYVSYHQSNPFKQQIEELMINTPLKLEIEHLKEEKEQLPTSENFEKQKKQLQFLEKYLQEQMSEEECEKVKGEMNKI